MFIPKRENKRERHEEGIPLYIELPLPPRQEPNRKKSEEENTVPRGVWTIDI